MAEVHPICNSVREAVNWIPLLLHNNMVKIGTCGCHLSSKYGSVLALRSWIVNMEFFFFSPPHWVSNEKAAWREEMRKQKHLWFGKQKKHWEYLGWLADCTETHRVSPAAAVAMMFKAIPPEQEQWDNPLLTCMIHWNVELIRQSNWLNICSCFIMVLKWALSLCMPGMAKEDG